MRQLPPTAGTATTTTLSRSATTLSRSASRRISTIIPSAEHVHDDCQCRIIAAPRNAINQLITDGDVPILRVEMTATDKLGLRAKRADGRTKYVIVLQALPDTLGSSHQNAITTCQLFHVADRMGKLQVEEVRAELCLWADFLCVPAGVSSRQVPRINEIYRNAYAVLVFDPRLRNTSGSVVELQAYLGALMEAHQKLALNGRIILVTRNGWVDMRAGSSRQSGDRHTIRVAEDYQPV